MRTEIDKRCDIKRSEDSLMTIREQQRKEDFDIENKKALRNFMIEEAADELCDFISNTTGLPTEIYAKSINLLNALSK